MREVAVMGDNIRYKQLPQQLSINLPLGKKCLTGTHDNFLGEKIIMGTLDGHP
ncbi:MAG: hypothetical protein ACFB2X_25500 [Rivularia sp. (in: cyanobacteria)]